MLAICSVLQRSLHPVHARAWQYSRRPAHVTNMLFQGHAPLICRSTYRRRARFHFGASAESPDVPPSEPDSSTKEPQRKSSGRFEARKYVAAEGWRSVVSGARAATDVFARRLRGEVKEEKWSVAMETVVEVIGAVLAPASNLVAVYQEGDAETRAEVEKALSLINSQMNRACSAIPCMPGVSRENLQIGSMTGAWLTPKDGVLLSQLEGDEAGTVDKPTILYFHGGAYITCSVNTHIRLISALAHTSEASVLAVNYRLAPMVGFDEILEDAVEAFDFLLQRGVPAHRIVLAGDSAGGHLALSLAAHLAELRPKDVPGGVLALSPWIDPPMSLDSEEDTWRTNSDIDYLGFAIAASPAPIIFRTLDEPEAHPFENLNRLPASVLAKMPPMLLQAGSNEVLLSEIREFASLVGSSKATLEVYQGMVHVFQIFLDVEPCALEGLKAAGSFVKRCTCSTNTEVDVQVPG